MGKINDCNKWNSEISPLVIGIAMIALIVLSIMNIHKLLNRKNICRKSQSNIDTYLQQRFDELESHLTRC